jgi:hypothetical protein
MASDKSLKKLAEDVRIETKKILEDSTSSSSSQTPSTYYNPLNPKTQENLRNSDLLQKRGEYTQTSKTLNKRWTSVQAWNHYALYNDNDYQYSEIGLCVTVNITPKNAGSLWDEVISVEDITPYQGSWWSYGTTPSQNITTVNTGTHIELRYDYTAFDTVGGIYSYANNSGIFPIKIKVVYTSGHVEVFDLLAPIGKQYRYNLALNYGWQSNLEQDTNICETSPLDWYSKGKNYRYSNTSAQADYYILTRFSPHGPSSLSVPVHNPSGNLAEIGYFLSYPTSSVNELHILNGFPGGWGDPMAVDFGANGIITPDQTTPAKQKFYRIDVLSQDGEPGVYNDTIGGKSPAWFIANYTSTTNTSSLTGLSYYIDNTYTVNDPTSFQSVISSINLSNRNQLFTYTAYYSENIPSCRSTPSVRYYVCDTVGNPNYYITTSLGSLIQGQCNTTTIPATDLPGGSNYNSGNVSFMHDPSCCDDCTLDLNVSVVSDATYGNTDGVVSWNAISAGVASGAPWTSGSQYTVVVTNAAGTVMGTSAPTGGNTFTDATCDTVNGSNYVFCDSSVKIVPGMQVSGSNISTTNGTGLVYVGSITLGAVSTNVTQFTLVDSLGGSINASSTLTNTTFTFATGMGGQHGALAPNTIANAFYVLCITDSSECEECATFMVNEGGPPVGCTDSTAANYDSTAVNDNGTCVLCDEVDGLLHDPGPVPATGGPTTPLFDSLAANGTVATAINSTSHNADGTLSVSASPISALLNYFTWDANSYFKIQLYKTLNQGDTSTAIGATLEDTYNTLTLDLVTIAAHTFTGLAYGYYTMRVSYVDDNSTSTLELCWTEWYGLVQAEVCDDQTNASYNINPTDPVLRFPNASLCSVALSCCTLDAISEFNIAGGACNIILKSQADCTPPRTVSVEWLYSSNGTTYTSLGTYNLGFITGLGPPMYSSVNNAINGTNWASVNGSGFYKIIITNTLTGTSICIEEEIYNYTAPVTDCMDQAAQNYNSLATCDCCCIYDSWDCDGLGNCTDPGTGNGAYLTFSDCQQNCPTPVIYGCTDPCATNYDPNATADDGNCTYTACLDFNSSNQYQNCCNQQYYSPSQIIGADNSCCRFPCDPQNTITVTATNSTSTCDVFNDDGTVNVTLTVNNTAPTWTWVIWDNSYTNIVYTDTTGGPASDGVYSGSGTSATYSLLGLGTYYAEITDSFGCHWNLGFTIGSTSPLVGCTDPDADNYNPLAICDCCCEVCGCLDPNASNYNPNANVLCECEYPDPPPSPCIPETLHKDREKVRACLSLKGTIWLSDYKIGMADDCTLMNKWKLILIEYLLSQEKEGISCLFNCADIRTPDPSAAVDCNALWVTGGPSTGLNHDPNHLGGSIMNSGEGTTVTVYDGYPTGWFGRDTALNTSSNFTFVGDVVKWDLPSGHPLASWLNNTIWTLTVIPNNPQGQHYGCTPNGKITHYTQCLDYNTISITTTTNYYDNFLNFVNKFCQDCNISILNNNNS